MNWMTQLLVAIGGASILSAAATIINQRVQAASVKARLAAADKISAERHEENKETLAEIREDIKRINGTVGRHDEALRNQEKEINRLRDKGA